MELTRTDAVFSRNAMVLFLCRNKSSQNDLKLHEEYFWNLKKILAKESASGGPHPVHEGAGRPPWGAPPCLVGPLDLHRPQLQLHIFTFGDKKNQRESFITFYDMESVRGFGEGDSSLSSSSTILHHQFHDAHRRA